MPPPSTLVISMRVLGARLKLAKPSRRAEEYRQLHGIGLTPCGIPRERRFRLFSVDDVVPCQLAIEQQLANQVPIASQYAAEVISDTPFLLPRDNRTGQIILKGAARNRSRPAVLDE